MKKRYYVFAIAAIIVFAIVLQTNAFGINKLHKLHGLHKLHKNLLNMTRMEGILEYINGSYYINSIELYLGNEWFLNSISKSDYDMDGNYEYVWQELQGLVNKSIVVNGLIKNNILYVSHINGIWYRMPRRAEIAEINGLLECIDGKYFVNGIHLIIKKGYSKSDIDRDGSLEKMWEELNGLVGQQIKVDGFMKNGEIIVFHINGIWAR